MNRIRVVEPSSSSRGVPARRSALVAALTLTALMLGAVPAVAMGKATHEPVSGLITARPGTLVRVVADALFDDVDVGEKPKFTGAFIPFQDHLESHKISTDADGTSSFFLKVMSADALNALPSPPANPFTLSSR